jgi:hypothetical protein
MIAGVILDGQAMHAMKQLQVKKQKLNLDRKCLSSAYYTIKITLLHF